MQLSPRLNIHYAFCIHYAGKPSGLVYFSETNFRLSWPHSNPTSAIKLSTVQGVDWNGLFFISSCYFLFHFVFPHFFFLQHRHLSFICWTYTRCAVPFYLSSSVIWIFFERCLGWFSVLFVLVTVNELSRLCWQLKKENWCWLAFKKMKNVCGCFMNLRWKTSQCSRSLIAPPPCGKKVYLSVWKDHKPKHFLPTCLNLPSRF